MIYSYESLALLSCIVQQYHVFLQSALRDRSFTDPCSTFSRDLSFAFKTPSQGLLPTYPVAPALSRIHSRHDQRRTLSLSPHSVFTTLRIESRHNQCAISLCGRHHGANQVTAESNEKRREETGHDFIRLAMTG